MESNYKPIGRYIRLVDERNSDLKINTLLGLSINKEFIPGYNEFWGGVKGFCNKSFQII